MNTGIKNKYQVLHLLVLSIVLFNVSFSSYAQEIVRGKILSDTEENLPYASVVMLSSQDSTLLTHSVSDSLGLFSLQLNKVPHKFILRVTYIGYYPYEAEYSEKEVGNIKLRTNSQLLGEVEKLFYILRGSFSNTVINSNGMANTYSFRWRFSTYSTQWS